MKIIRLTDEQARGFLLALQHAICKLQSSEAQAWLGELERLIQNAPRLDNVETAKKDGPRIGEGWGTNPHPNDEIHQQISTDTLRPQVPVRLSNAPAASEPGEFDMNLPKVPE